MNKKLNYEHYEAQVQTLSEKIIASALNLAEELDVPLDLLMPAFDIALFNMMKKNLNEVEPKLKPIMAKGLVVAQAGAFKVRLKWLQDIIENG